MTLWVPARQGRVVPEYPKMNQQQKPLSCLECKTRKQKCDRVLPKCGRCLRLGADCEFPRSRKVPVGRPMRVQALQNRLVELEDQIAAFTASQQATGVTISPHPHQAGSSSETTPEVGMSTIPEPITLDSAPTDIASPILTDYGLTPEIMFELTNGYFNNLAYAAPMIHRSRYVASLSQPVDFQPPLCLQYVIMALGSYTLSCSPTLTHRLYQIAKSHATSEGLEGGKEDSIMLSHIQTWSLIANFEALNMMFSQALTSLYRGICAAQTLGLHQLGEERERLAPESGQERIILEEKRRTWWFLFLSDRLVAGTTGLPLSIDQEDVTTLLPTSEKVFAEGRAEPTSSLKPLITFTTLGPSILGVRVFVANLFQRVLDHTSYISPGERTKTDQEFWDQHCRLDNELALCLIKLPEHSRINNPIHNRDAVIINMELRAAMISLDRGAIWSLRFSGKNQCSEELKRQQARHSQEGVMNSAREIAHILRIAGAYPSTFMNPILCFAVYLAALAFIEDYLDTEQEQSQDTALMFLSSLVTIGLRNIVAKSLAKQVAKDMSYVGIEVPPDLESQVTQPDLPSLFAMEAGAAAINVSFQCFI